MLRVVPAHSVNRFAEVVDADAERIGIPGKFPLIQPVLGNEREEAPEQFFLAAYGHLAALLLRPFRKGGVLLEKGFQQRAHHGIKERLCSAVTPDEPDQRLDVFLFCIRYRDNYFLLGVLSQPKSGNDSE